PSCGPGPMHSQASAPESMEWQPRSKASLARSTPPPVRLVWHTAGVGSLRAARPCSHRPAEPLQVVSPVPGGQKRLGCVIAALVEPFHLLFGDVEVEKSDVGR